MPNDLTMLRSRTHHCETCGALLLWGGHRGFLTGCEHYPPDVAPDKLTRRERNLVAVIEREPDAEYLGS